MMYYLLWDIIIATITAWLEYLNPILIRMTHFFFLEICVFKESWRAAFPEQLMGIEKEWEQLLLWNKFCGIIELFSTFI